MAQLIARLRRRVAVGNAALAACCYVPLLLTHRGMVGADTKQYLYLDPGRLLSRAPWLWDNGVGFGTVTHQNIGYLFPMGPYYWLMDAIGLPDWVAQRIWFGSIMFLAGLGVRSLLRVLRWQGPGVTVASFAYALSPYVLHYVYKHSVILLPFTALPWLIGLTAQSLRHRGWRYPAAFALVALAAGGVNATSLLLVLLGPGVWVLHATLVDKEHTVRSVIGPLARIGLLTAATSTWWITGLMLQGKYGIDILRYTESYRTISDAASSPEIWRGFGYWFVYGLDAFGPWFKAANTYTTNVAVLALSFVVPGLAIVAALWTRFRYRIFFVAMAGTGLVVSVGGHTIARHSRYGALFLEFVTTRSGMAMRSTPRALPLLALSLAVFLGAGVAALSRRAPERRKVIALAAVTLIILNLHPLWTGRMVDEFLERPEDIPASWTEAAARLDAGDPSTRALEEPGSEFANYRWGATVDPITPGITERDYVARERVPLGSEASADLLGAVDTPLQDGSFEPASLAPMLRLMGVGDLVLRSDLEYERYLTPRPRVLADAIARTPGLAPAEGFGTAYPNVADPQVPLIDEIELATPASVRDPAPVSVHKVKDPLAMVRSVSAARPQIVAGSGEGLVSAAGAGVLDPTRLVVYSGSVTNRPAELQRLLDADADLVVTDSNRRAARRLGPMRDTEGYTELADQARSEDATDSRLDLFGRPIERSDADGVQTVSVQRGVYAATASGYGNSTTFTPGDRAAYAIDGDPSTAWRVGFSEPADGEWIELRRQDGAGAASSLRLVQPLDRVNRWITKVRLTFDGGESRVVTLGESSRTEAGQAISLGERRFTRLRITVLATNFGVLQSYRGVSGVGFAEVDLGADPTLEVIRPPVDLVRAAGSELAEHRLAYVFQRRTASLATGAPDEEAALRRLVELPAERSFELGGWARLHPDTPDVVTDALVGVAGAAFSSSARLQSTPASRASRAFDGDATTLFQGRIGDESPVWIEANLSAPASVTAQSLTVVADARHSVPTAMHFEVDGVAGPSIRLPKVTRGGRDHQAVVRFAPQTLTGSRIRLVVDRVDDATTAQLYGDDRFRLPIGIAEVGGLERLATIPPPATPIAAACRTDLLSADGVPIAVQVHGTVDDLEQRRPLRLTGCDGASTSLASGTTLVQTEPGAVVGVSIETLSLVSPAISAGPTTGTTSAAPASPRLRVTSPNRLTYEIRPTRSLRSGFWLVVGQSYNAGWHLRVGGRDLGPSTLVSGYANGWWIDPEKVGKSPTITVSWEPQRLIWWGLASSALGLLICLALAFRPAKPNPAGTLQRTRPAAVGLWDAFGRPAGWWATAAVSLVAAFGSFMVVSRWWSILLAAGLAGAAMRTRVGWRALRVGCVAMFAAMAAYVVAKQWKGGFDLDFGWPRRFEPIHDLGMLTVVLLGIECLVEAVRAGWRRDAEIEE